MSEHRAAEDAAAFFRRAMENSGVIPTQVSTDQAAAYPPALAEVVPDVEHETGTLVQQRVERDHQRLKGRRRPLRGFQSGGGAQIICGGQGFVRSVQGGFYRLGVVMAAPVLPCSPLLPGAWDECTAELLIG